VGRQVGLPQEPMNRRIGQPFAWKLGPSNGLERTGSSGGVWPVESFSWRLDLVAHRAAGSGHPGLSVTSRTEFALNHPELM